ncbi:hypothetical protein HMPREF1987_00184 [Peptostreptococcaceae bacterium oral taxon 113 str. W5053]|nr:hypothetical protein HMPREF1987_00184 [Peptostreptococcaceae bacterium oral taxon 113 str. W5053]
MKLLCQNLSASIFQATETVAFFSQNGKIQKTELNALKNINRSAILPSTDTFYRLYFLFSSFFPFLSYFFLHFFKNC